MKKLIYVSLTPMDNISQGSNGVTKKIFQQINGFKQLNLEVYYTCVIKNDVFLVSPDNQKNYLFKVGKNHFSMRAKLSKYLIKYKKIEKFDYVYIRYTGNDLFTTLYVRRLQKKQSKVMLEIPTFPYKGEKCTSLKGCIGYTIDMFFNLFLKNYVDVIVSTNNYDKIFDIPVVQIENGVNIEEFTPHRYNKKNEIHFIGVAMMAKWHGFDRMIEGIKHYNNCSNNNIKVVLHLVGDGSEIPYYKELCIKYNLEDNVIFHGKLGGENLDEVFEQADIAVSSLGIYRIGLNQVSTIKTKEYCARGIPFIYGYNENCFTDKQKFALKVRNDDTPININELLEWYERDTNSYTANEMINYARNNLTWKKQLEKVLVKVGD